MSNKQSSTHSTATRALALALAVLVASGIVVYLITFIMNLFA